MKLNNENYFSKEADIKYLSVSQYKNFLECEKKALGLMNKEWDYGDKPCFLIGSYFHAWAEGALDNFIEENSSKIMMKNKKDKLAQFREVDEIIKTLEANPVQYKRILDIIQNKNNKKEQIFTGKLFNTDWKIKIDIYNPKDGYLCDLKLIKSLYDKFYNPFKLKYENFILNYQYDLQMYIYSEVEKEANNRENILLPVLACITKEKPINTALFINFDKIRNNDDFVGKVNMDVQRIIELKQGTASPIGCDKCDYCRSVLPTKVMNYDGLFI